MKQNFKSYVTVLLGIILITCIPFNKILAQDNAQVKEPPVPVYVISPYHEDSVSAAFEGSSRGMRMSNDSTAKKLDTLQQQIQKSSAESTVHFIWLYTLLALLGIMNIVILFSASRIKKEVAQLRRFEHQKMLLASEASALSQPAPRLLESSYKPEPVLLPAPVRIRKPRTVKPRVKKRK
jgi:hypothetical protein